MSEKPSDIDHPERADVHHHDAAGLSPVNTKEEAILSEFSPAETKAIIHRVDRRLVATVGIMYCISLMDRTNLSVAAIAGYAN
jgi:hypothetical protein